MKGESKIVKNESIILVELIFDEKYIYENMKNISYF
jgi:hypothetical protein